MSFLLYFTFIYLIILVAYYFIYLKNINNNHLFIIILNFILLILLPLYYCYYKDNIYSLIVSFFLTLSSFSMNLKIKKIFQETKIPFIIYFLLTSYILGKIITTFL